MRQVGHAGQDGLDIGLDFGQACGTGFQLLLDGADLGHHRLGAGMIALALELADLLGQRVALGLQLFGAGLDGLAFGFQRGEGGHVQVRLRVLARLQAGHYLVEVFAEQEDV